MEPQDERPGGYESNPPGGSQPGASTPGPEGPPGSSGPSEYPYPPPPPPGSYPAPTPESGGTNAGRPWSIAGLVCGVLAIIILPIILGPLGAIFGFIGHSKGDPLGKWVGIGSIVTTVVGILLGIAILNATDDDAFIRFR